MNLLSKLAAVASLGFALAAGTASAAAVECPTAGDRASDPTINRYIRVNPALPGFCYYQDSNVSGNPDQGTIFPGAQLIELDNLPDGEGSASDGTGLLTWSTNASRTAGSFSLDGSLWEDYERIFVAFHFGGGQNTPSFFAVELAAFQTGGTFELLRALLTDTTPINGLSNIRIVGLPCAPGTTNCNDDEDEDVPEPATLALVGIAALGLALRRRRTV